MSYGIFVNGNRPKSKKQVKEAMAGDYDHLLYVCARWVSVE